MYGNFFPNLGSIISEKCMVTPNFFLGGDSDSPCKDLLFPHTHKLHKNTFVLVGKFLKEFESVFEHTRDVQNVW